MDLPAQLPAGFLEANLASPVMHAGEAFFRIDPLFLLSFGIIPLRDRFLDVDRGRGEDHTNLKGANAFIKKA